MYIKDFKFIFTVENKKQRAFRIYFKSRIKNIYIIYLKNLLLCVYRDYFEKKINFFLLAL